MLLALFMSAGPRPPTLCVDAVSALADDIIEALRIRMERSQLEVRRCDPNIASETWRVTVRPEGDDVVSLAIVGAVHWTQTLDIHDLRPSESARLVALHVVEAVRPSVDATLLRLRDETPEQGLEEQAAAADRPHVALAVKAGPVFATRPFATAAHLQIGAVFGLGSYSIVPAIALRTMAGAELSGVTAGGGELHLEIAGRRQWDRLELGLYLRGRGTRIAISSSNVNVRDGARTYFDYGAGISGFVWAWRGASFALGLVVQTTVWARPHWLSVEGQELLRQARVDVFLGPVLELPL